MDFVAAKMRQAGDLGLLGHSIPENYGGLGLDKNRLLIPGSFFQKAAKSAFGPSLIEKAEYSLKNGGYKRRGGNLEKLEEAVAFYKDLFLVTAGTAYRLFEKGIQNEQETLMKLADIAIHIYSAESAVLRTKKAIQWKGYKNNWKVNLTKTVIEQSSLAIQQAATGLFSSLLQGEERVEALRNVNVLLSEYQFEGAGQRNRHIADEMLEAGQYVS